MKKQIDLKQFLINSEKNMEVKS